MHMKFGLYYNYEISGGKWTKGYAASFEEVALAEKLGFDLVAVAEHHFQEFGITPSPITVCAALAAVTKKIRVASGVVLLPLHNPIRVAEDATMVDIISNGRFILGMGIGWNRNEADGFQVKWNQRKARFEEGLAVVQQLLTSKNVTFNGKHFSLSGVTLMPRPVQNPLPIWLAAIAEPAVRRAGRLGHIWMQPPILPLKILKQRIEAYKEELKASTGKDYSQVERPLRREAFIDVDSSAAFEYGRESTEEHYRYYLREGLELLDEEGRILKISDIDSLWNILKNRYIIGSPDEFIGQVERFGKETGATTVVLKLHSMDPDEYHPKVMKAIELIGKKVLPYFRDSKK